MVQVLEHHNNLRQWSAARTQLLNLVKSGVSRRLYGPAVRDLAIKALEQVFEAELEKLVAEAKEDG